MVTIYGNSLCVWCIKSKALAESYGLKYEWKDTDDPAIKSEFDQRFPDVHTIPQIVWNDRHIPGYQAFAQEIESTMGGYGQGAL